ncbi:outer membrane protein assembly factor BamB family protein [Stieleria varia]|uniref:Outer membrane biogenesis protein BamB n=1 Tax=Stieleria varia TaxID=2528005 RepID=A0A5C6ATS0_9BACT|nr:PQQ-binding-like beta-propeller repeat protein [Stieleria varia]TWU02412.1 outer membrane biogenesis protein BamB [Stieleria varia]
MVRRPLPSLAAVVAALILCPLMPTSAESPDWNQWRGPNRDAQLTGAAWPEKLSGKLELVWEQPHSPSYSGPIICGDLVFTTETVDKKLERVTAYRLTSGEKVWSVQWEGAMAVPFFAAKNGDWIRSTPICDGSNLLVLGMRDVLVSLDPPTGNEHWRVDFHKEIGTPIPSFGAVCSPIIDGDFAFVQTGGALVKVRLSDGEVIWQSLEQGGGMSTNGAFSSPVIATLSGVRQLVVQTRTDLCGVSIDDGSVLWKEPIEAFRGMNILTPLVLGDRIFTAAHSGRSQMFSVSRSDDGTWSIRELWQQKTQGYMSSPVVIGDTIYLHQKSERFSALSVSDGSILWTTPPTGSYWSMVAAGDKILALTNDGDLVLIQADEGKYNEIDRQKVANDSWAHLAIQDEMVIVRDLASLKVFRWSK